MQLSSAQSLSLYTTDICGDAGVLKGCLKCGTGATCGSWTNFVRPTTVTASNSNSLRLFIFNQGKIFTEIKILLQKCWLLHKVFNAQAFCILL